MGRGRNFTLIVIRFGMAAGTALLIACAPARESAPQGSDGVITNPETEVYRPEPLLWEGKTSDGVLWSAYSYQLIGSQAAPDLLPGTRDIAKFCPSYSTLREAQKINFWAYLVSAISMYESGFDARARDAQPDFDDATGLWSYAEGLMHISYREILRHTFCALDWETDSQLPGRDERRTIFNPLKNLDCGIKILATEVASNKLISHGFSPWKSLRPTGRNSRVQEIQRVTRALPFCH